MPTDARNGFAPLCVIFCALTGLLGRAAQQDATFWCMGNGECTKTVCIGQAGAAQT